MGANLAFDLFLAGVAVTTVIIMIRNMRSTEHLSIVRVRTGEGMTVYIDGRRLVSVAYVADGLPREGEDLPARLVRLAKSSRVSVTFVSSMYSTSKSSVLKTLDEEIKRAEFAYSATRHVKYRERLSFLEGLYKEVLREQVPYVGTFGMIVWVDANDRNSMLNAEAFKELVEAEAGVRMRRLQGSDLAALLSSMEPSWLSESRPLVIVANREQINDEHGVVLGEDLEEPGNLVILRWPEGFRVHVGVFGPTGRGKTVLLSGLVAQLTSMSHLTGDPKSVVVVDPKGDLASLLRRLADAYLTPSAEECVTMRRLDGIAARLIESSSETGEGSKINVCEGEPKVLEGLTVYDLSSMPNELRNVYGSLLLSSLALEASEGRLGSRVVVVIDEAWRFVRGSGFHFEFMLREGRSKGLYAVYATQLPSDVGKTVVDNTGHKVVFGGFTNYYVEMAAQLGIEGPERLKELPVGHALLRDEAGRVKEVKVIDFTRLYQTT